MSRTSSCPFATFDRSGAIVGRYPSRSLARQAVRLIPGAFRYELLLESADRLVLETTVSQHLAERKALLGRPGRFRAMTDRVKIALARLKFF